MKFLEQRDRREKRLQEELQNEKQKFTEASRLAVNAIRRDLMIENWVRAYPIESLAITAIAGFAAGYALATLPSLDIRTIV